MSSSVYFFIHYCPTLGFCYALVLLGVSVGHVQTISTVVGQAFLGLVLPLAYHEYCRLRPSTFLYDHKSNTTSAFIQHLTVEHFPFSRPTFCTIQHGWSSTPSYRTCLLASEAPSCHRECHMPGAISSTLL
jgi:hypothetical protein